MLNSAWFCDHRTKADARNLWLGLPLLQKLEVDRLQQKPAARLRVALVHHPKEWLHEAECNSYGDRPNALRLLSQGCDVILSGHVHGMVEPPSQLYDGAVVFTGGATYEGARWRNNFSLLQFDLDERIVTRRAFEYNPVELRWFEVEYGSSTRDLPQHRIYRHGAGKSPDDRIPGDEKPDLNGRWVSVYWQEGQVIGRRYRNIVQFEIDQEDHLNGMVVESDGGQKSSGFSIQGKLEQNRFISGRWDTESDNASLRRWGTLQLSVARDSSGVLRMKGRWLGFDRHGKINVGQWRFRKIDDTTVASDREKPKAVKGKAGTK